jgi:hypothetical protein
MHYILFRHFMLQKVLKIMEAVVPQTLPICMSPPTGKDWVYALCSVLTFYATKSL